MGSQQPGHQAVNLVPGQRHIAQLQPDRRVREDPKDVALDSEATLAALIMPTGIWSDGSTLYSVGHIREKLYAHNVASTGTHGARQTGKECELAPDYAEPRGAWSDGTTMWVADSQEKLLVAYGMDSFGCQGHRLLQDLRLATENNNPLGRLVRRHNAMDLRPLG